MSDPIYAGGEGRVAFSAVDFEASALTPDDVTSVKVTISDDTGANVVTASDMTWDAAAGEWEYLWTPTPGDGGGRVYRAEGVAVDLLGGVIVAWTYIVLAAPPVPVLIGGCGGPWGSPAGLDCLDSVPVTDQELVTQAASGMLFAASGRQFTGICSDKVWPGPAELVLLVNALSDGSTWRGPVVRSMSVPIGYCWSALQLPGFPIVDVTAVTIEGEALAPGSWNIIDDRWIVRRGGLSWPGFQWFDRVDGDTGTWSVEYTWGVPIPPEGLLAFRVLSCELALSLKDDKACRLPKRLTQITREGFSAVVLDPFKFLDEGKFGVYEIDAFINDVNPHHLTRDGKVLNVDLLAEMPHRIR